MAKKRKRTAEDEEFDRRAMANARLLREYGEGRLDRERGEQETEEQLRRRSG